MQLKPDDLTVLARIHSVLIAAGLDALAEWELRPIDGQNFPDSCVLFITGVRLGTTTIPRERIKPDELNKFRLKYPLHGMYSTQDSEKIAYVLDELRKYQKELET